MDLAGFRAEFLLASGRGVGDAATTAGVDSTVDVATAEEAGDPFPAAEDFAVGSVTVTAEAPDVASVEADVLSVAVAVASAVPDVPSAAPAVASVVDPSAAVDMPSVEAAVPLVEVDAASVEVDIPLAEADTVEAVMVVGTGRFRH